MRRRLSLLLALSIGCPSALHAQQQVGPLIAGTRVRVETCGGATAASGPRARRQTGQVVHADAETLILQVDASRLDTVPLAYITAGWQSVGRRSRWATGFRGLVLGVASGSLLGLGLDALNDNRTGDGSGEAFESVLLPLVGGVLGGSLGAVIGVASGGEQWKPLRRSVGSSYDCAGRLTWR